MLIAAFEGWNDAGDAAATRCAGCTSAGAPSRSPTSTPRSSSTSPPPAPRCAWTRASSGRSCGPPSSSAPPRSRAPTSRWCCCSAPSPSCAGARSASRSSAVAGACDVRLAITLGALLADVPHAAPVSVIGTAYDPRVVDRLGLTQSSYEGPTGIVGVLHDALPRAGVDVRLAVGRGAELRAVGAVTEGRSSRWSSAPPGCSTSASSPPTSRSRRPATSARSPSWSRPTTTPRPTSGTSRRRRRRRSTRPTSSPRSSASCATSATPETRWAARPPRLLASPRRGEPPWP